MKKLLVALLVVLMLAGCAAPAAKPVATMGAATPTPTPIPAPTPTPAPTPIPDADFRNITWGMSRNEVITSEGKEPSRVGSDGDYYDGLEIMGFPVTLGYTYNGDKVSSGVYFFDQQHTNKTDYVDDYKNIKEALVSKYGQPAEDNEIWKDDLYKDSPGDYGMAVSAGHLAYYTKWNTATTEIIALLSGDNFNISLFIRYKDNKAPDVTPDASGL